MNILEREREREREREPFVIIIIILKKIYASHFNLELINFEPKDI